MAVAVSSAVAGCVTTGGAELTSDAYGKVEPYAELGAERFKVAAVDTSAIDPRFLRQVVDYPTPYPAGTVVVDPHKRFLYLVTSEGRAVRYGVGVGRAGLAFAGTANIQVKKEWPHWAPTRAMIAREPARYAKWAAGMKGGEGNPLGARALYLFRGGNDTRYRIHGTNEPESIGHAVSSGCIRMLNQDIVDLYKRVPVGSKVVVL